MSRQAIPSLVALGILLVALTGVICKPFPESKDSDKEDIISSSENERKDDVILFLDEDSSDLIFLENLSSKTEKNKDALPLSPKNCEGCDHKEAEDVARILFKPWFKQPWFGVRPVAVMPVAVVQPMAPQVVRVPSSLKVVVGAHKPHVYLLRPPHYRPTLVSSALTGFTPFTSSSILPGITGSQEQALEVDASLPSLSQGEVSLQTSSLKPGSVTGTVVPVAHSKPPSSLISGILSNVAGMMNLGTKVPASESTISLAPSVLKPSATGSAIDLQVQKVVDVMAHANP